MEQIENQGELSSNPIWSTQKDAQKIIQKIIKPDVPGERGGGLYGKGDFVCFNYTTPMHLHGGPNIYEIENFLTGPLWKFCLAISMCLILLTNLSFLQPWTTLFQTVKRLFPWYLVPSLYSLVPSPQFPVPSPWSLVPGTQSLVTIPQSLVPCT